MSGVVEFNIVELRELYPHLLGVSDTQLKHCFIKSESILNNTKRSMVCDLEERKMLLYLLTAHMATIQDRINKGNDSVGRVASASEGSVSVSLDFPTNGNAWTAWFAQTPYGAEYWMLTAKYRTMQYVVTATPTYVSRKV